MDGDEDPSRDRLDTVFEVLSDRRRRQVLYSLRRREDGVATVEELATELAATIPADETAGADGRAAETSRADWLATSLRHTHLPKLAAAGLVEHDHRSGTVRYRGGGELLTACLDRARQFERG